MAYIIDADTLLSNKAPDDGGLDFEQRVTVFRMAQAEQGHSHSQCAKAWRDYRALDPDGARLVEQYVTKGETPVKATRPKREAARPVSGTLAAQRAYLMTLASDPYVTDSDRTSARNALARLDGNR